MNKGIAFFDFDGTITTKDTLLEFIKYSRGTMSFYWGFLLNRGGINRTKRIRIQLEWYRERIRSVCYNRDCLRVAPRTSRVACWRYCCLRLDLVLARLSNEHASLVR